ncbi:MAG: hypothetical protein ACRC1J_04545 [Sandaracinobacteroides sp.]
MEYINLNLVPITVAAVIGLLIGLAHFLIARPGDRPGLDFVILSAIAEFWLAAILCGALILGPKLADPWVIALATAVVIWIGFVVPVLMVTLRFRGFPGPMAAADSLHWLVVMVAQAAVMQALGLVAPN